MLARRDVMTLLGGANTSCVATGVAGVGSNKGAVAIACQVWGTELCFVNAHLAAHQSRSAERNKMFRVRPSPPASVVFCLAREPRRALRTHSVLDIPAVPRQPWSMHTWADVAATTGRNLYSCCL